MKNNMKRAAAVMLSVMMLGTVPGIETMAAENLTQNYTGGGIRDSKNQPEVTEEVTDQEENQTEVPDAEVPGTEVPGAEVTDAEVPGTEATDAEDSRNQDVESEEASNQEENQTEEVAAETFAVPDVSQFSVNASLFDDVDATAWYFPYVTYAMNKGIMTGKGDSLFAPSEDLSRAQFATVLWRVSGSPETSYSAKYPDVPKGTFFTTPVMWASQKDVGVIFGYDEGTFGPSDMITREQMAAMLYRYAQYRGFDTENLAELGKFPDASSVHSFAADAMKWAVGAGIITGDRGKLNPEGHTSRAVCSTMLQRFCDKYMPEELKNLDFSAQCNSAGVTMINESTGEFRVTAAGVTAVRKSQQIQAKVWCSGDKSDQHVYTMNRREGGSYGAMVSPKNHGYHTGTYSVQVCILLDVGVRVPLGNVMTIKVSGSTGHLQVMGYVQNVYNQVGKDLNACYWWVVNNVTYKTLPIPLNPPAGYNRSEWYAVQAFQNRQGNCYVYAAAFYYLALGLGYDAHFIEGQVGMAAGGFGPHGWVIINTGSGSYICDPEAQYEIGRYNFYMQPVGSPVLQYRW